MDKKTEQLIAKIEAQIVTNLVDGWPEDLQILQTTPLLSTDEQKLIVETFAELDRVKQENERLKQMVDSMGETNKVICNKALVIQELNKELKTLLSAYVQNNLTADEIERAESLTGEQHQK